MGARISAQSEAVIARHHEVEHDQVNSVFFQCRPHATPARGGGGAVAVALQVGFQQFADFLVVINNEYVFHSYFLLQIPFRGEKTL